MCKTQIKIRKTGDEFLVRVCMRASERADKPATKKHKRAHVMSNIKNDEDGQEKKRKENS